MRTALTSIASGVLFGAGLALGGMTDPARVRGFLDIFGDWDPTLAFVMGGAVIVMAVAWSRAWPNRSSLASFTCRQNPISPPVLSAGQLFSVSAGGLQGCVRGRVSPLLSSNL